MPNKSKEALIVCPFYMGMTEKDIHCEAAPPAHRFEMRFTSSARKKDHLYLQCADHVTHRSCPFAGILYAHREQANGRAAKE